MTQLDIWLANSKPLIPVIVIEDIAHAIPMAKALAAGGVHLLEITLRTEAGLIAIKQINENVPEVIVGAGTVCTAEEYQQAIEAGAQFIVSPGLSTEWIEKDLQDAMKIMPSHTPNRKQQSHSDTEISLSLVSFRKPN